MDEGALSQEQMIRIMFSLGLGCTGAVRSDILSFAEFLVFIQCKFMEAFKVFDHNADGFISATELQHQFEIFGEHFEESEVTSMIAEVDVNGDGQIDFEEFVMFMMHKP